MTIKSLENRLAALEPTPPGEDFDWIKILSSEKLKILDDLISKWQTLPENERVPTPDELALLADIEKRRELYEEKRRDD